MAGTKSYLELLDGSPQQTEIYNYFTAGGGPSHGLIEARAGSGKTTTIVQLVLRLGQSGASIGVVSFNNHVIKELKERFTLNHIKWAQAMTYNSLGFGACIRAFQSQVFTDKTDAILDEIMPKEEWFMRADVRRLVSLSKAHLQSGDNRDELQELVEKYNLEYIQPTAYHYVGHCMRRAKSPDMTSIVDFDDQCWLPEVLNLPTRTFDILLIDEAQDTNLMQQHLAMRACPRGQIVVVGDRHQSIYGFRGADVDAMPRMTDALQATERGIVTFPLTVSWRCFRKAIQLAQAIVPDITAAPNAVEGEIFVLPREEAINAMKPNDMVVCRVNRDLVPVCYALIRRGVKAQIRGRDIGKNLIELIVKLRATSMPDLMCKLDDYFDRESAKLTGRKSGAALINLTDKVDCLKALSEGVNDIPTLRQNIETIFSDEDESGSFRPPVLLGTVHKLKGLEADHVFVLSPNLMPHPMSKAAWEHQQELNLAYVAVTRAKYTLTFVDGGIPPMFNAQMTLEEPAGSPVDALEPADPPPHAAKPKKSSAPRKLAKASTKKASK